MWAFKGRNVVLDKKFGAPMITNDGVTIAKEIELPDPFENMGAKLVKEVAKKTDDVAGDGTTTATVLAWSMVREGLRNVAAGANPMALKKGIEKAVAAAVESIQSQAKDVDDKTDIANVATISAADSSIGEVIAEAIDKSTTQIRSWQDGSLVREIVSDGTYSVSMTFIETNQDVVELYYGATLASGELGIDPRATGGRQSFVIDVIDGTSIERTYIPAGEITSVGERTLASGEAIGYEVTITAYADADSDVATKFFSDFGSTEP